MVGNPEDRLYHDEAHFVVLPLCADALSLTVSERQTNILEYKKSKIKDFFFRYFGKGVLIGKFSSVKSEKHTYE